MTMQVNLREFERDMNDLAELKESVLKSAYKYFVATTPKDTGNARRNTRLTKDTIEANYPYADRLNTGWSKQAPDGMTSPTEEFIRNEVQNVLKGK